MDQIRPFDYSDEAYRIALDINAAVFDEPPDALEEWRHDDDTWDKSYPFFRDFIWRGETVIGYVETFQSPYAYHPQKFSCIIYVHPAHDGPEVRPLVLAHVLERLKERPLVAIMSGMLDDKVEAMRFFDDYGFERKAEEKISKLDVTGFDAGRFADKLAAVRGRGIDIVTLQALQAGDPGWQEKLYDLDITVNRDIPSQGEKHYPPFEEWRKKRLAGPSYDPAAWFIALDGEQYIGQSQGSINRESDLVQFSTGVTTTRREYRRLGVATALKVHIIEYVKSQGVTEIFTTNDANNPMYRLNLALGFQPQPSWVRVEKRLDG